MNSLYFKLGNDTETYHKLAELLESIPFQNQLTPLITPPEILDKTIKTMPESGMMIGNSLLKKLTDKNLENSSWRFTSSFQNYKLDKDSEQIAEYTRRRKYEHLYDPRISLAVYFNHLNEKFSSGSTDIPFSWEDWVDLSYLNKFLESRDSNTCAAILNDKKQYSVSLKTAIDPNEPSINTFDKTFCLDNSDYMTTENGKYRDEKLLPGFNFKQRIDETSNFIFKSYNAKSYLLSFAAPPTFIYFLNENGTYYKVKPHQSSSIMRNGLFENYINRDDFDGFDPINELKHLDSRFLTHNENDFANSLTDNKNKPFQLDIPESNFVLDVDTQFKELFEKDKSLLEENEFNFINSLEYSKSLSSKDVPKYFREVNINWPASYHGHKLKENGGHFDARFFSGFISEMPASELTFRSPYYDSKKSPEHSIDTANKRRSSVLSHLLHSLLTMTFHDGIFLFPAHGSLLSWYFTSMSFPWDSDGDVQLPVKDLAEFCLRFNNSLIVENPKYGTGKYFIDCSSSLTHRGKETGVNNIDARVIDVDTGLYVDLTGLAISSDRLDISNMNRLQDWLPSNLIKTYPVAKKKKKGGSRDNKLGPVAARKALREAKKEALDKVNERELFELVLELHKEAKIYNCRNDHFYTYDLLSPVRLTLFEGAPTFVAANERSLKAVLEHEYTSRAVGRQAWENYVYSKPLKMWIPAADVYETCQNNDLPIYLGGTTKSKKNKKNVKGETVLGCYLQNEGIVLSDLLKRSIYEITSDEVLYGKNGKNSFINQQPRLNLLEELYQDSIYLNAHSKEMDKFCPNWEWKTPLINDENLFDIPKDWTNLGEWLLEDHKPPRMPIFDYLLYSEAYDQDEEIISFSNNTM